MQICKVLPHVHCNDRRSIRRANYGTLFDHSDHVGFCINEAHCWDLRCARVLFFDRDYGLIRAVFVHDNRAWGAAIFVGCALVVTAPAFGAVHAIDNSHLPLQQRKIVGEFIQNSLFQFRRQIFKLNLPMELLSWWIENSISNKFSVDWKKRCRYVEWAAQAGS